MSEQITRPRAREIRDTLSPLYDLISYRMRDRDFLKRYNAFYSSFLFRTTSNYIYGHHVLSFVRPYVEGYYFTENKIAKDGFNDFDAQKTGIVGLLHNLTKCGLIETNFEGRFNKYKMNEDSALVIGSVLLSCPSCMNGTCIRCNGMGYDRSADNTAYNYDLDSYIKIDDIYYDKGISWFRQSQENMANHNALENYCSDECIKNNHRKQFHEVNGRLFHSCWGCSQWENTHDCNSGVCWHFNNKELCSNLIPAFVHKLTHVCNV